jgi:hypothetical protein
VILLLNQYFQYDIKSVYSVRISLQHGVSGGQFSMDGPRMCMHTNGNLPGGTVVRKWYVDLV